MRGSWIISRLFSPIDGSGASVDEPPAGPSKRHTSASGRARIPVGVGIIGVGRRGLELARVLVEHGERAGIRLVALHNRTRSRAEAAVEELSPSAATGTKASAPEVGTPRANPSRVPIRVYDSPEELIDDPTVGLVMVCTPQYAHREPACLTLRAGKFLSLDKPIAHTVTDAVAIARAEQAAARLMIMSFTRRFEAPWRKAWDLIHREHAIGPVRMILARNVIPYHIYFHTWHRRLEWSGGALADKMSHMFDVFLWFARADPLRLHAFGGQAVFSPDADAPERCSACDRRCPYRAADGPNTRRESDSRPDDMYRSAPSATDFGRRRSDGSSRDDTDRATLDAIRRRTDTCVWLPGADINDHGVVSIEMEGGIKASLFWALFGPDADDQETVEVVGEAGRIILTRQTGAIDLVSEHGARHRIIDARGDRAGTSHFGADINYIHVLGRYARGEKPIVSGRDGLRVARMVEAAHRSIREHGRLIELREIEDITTIKE